MHSHPADPLPGFPSVFLWAWEEPENLQFLDPHSTGIAFLARTVILHDGSVTVRPRLEPMRYPTGAVLMAVVRVEAGRAELPSTESTAAAVADAAAIFNRQLPLALLKQAAASPQLPPNVRGELATVVYVRSAMMQPQPRFDDIYRILKSPGMREHVNSGFQRSEGMAQIDDYRDNWWCAIKEQSPAAPADGDEPPTMLKEVYRGSAPEATFLSPAEREQARQEATGLSAVPTGPNWLAAQAAQWAEKAPSDPRVPEALHLAVRATRFGCTDKNTGEFSKRAFDLLRQRYPKSPWTAQTRLQGIDNAPRVLPISPAICQEATRIS